MANRLRSGPWLLLGALKQISLPGLMLLANERPLVRGELTA